MAFITFTKLFRPNHFGAFYLHFNHVKINLWRIHSIFTIPAWNIEIELLLIISDNLFRQYCFDLFNPDRDRITFIHWKFHYTLITLAWVIAIFIMAVFGGVYLGKKDVNPRIMVKYARKTKSEVRYTFLCRILRLQIFLNSFHTTDLFWYPLKTSENIWFSDVFRGYQKRSEAWNGLKKNKPSILKDGLGHEGLLRVKICFGLKQSQMVWTYYIPS